MNKHTPGPWRIRLDGAEPVGEKGNFEPIGGCGCCGSPWANADTEEENNANARLIAAAPELLEALNLIASEHRDDAAVWMRSVARAAIAKTTGESK